MKLVVIGLGNVGQGLLHILHTERERLRAQFGFEAQITAALTHTRGVLVNPGGLALDGLIAAAKHSALIANYPHPHSAWDGQDAAALIRELHADVVIEASPSNLQTARPALDYVHAAFDAGSHVVMANKGPVLLAYPELRQRAQLAGRALLFEATVMAGTPAIRLAREALAGSGITRVRGILNGTTNYMLTEMEHGRSYDEALRLAQELGYAEADPSADVQGWDAAAKAGILSAALFERPLRLNEMQVQGITQLNQQVLAEAAAAGERWKLIAEITAEGARVQPMRLSLSHPLAAVSGTTNAITYSTHLLGDVTLTGAGAGGIQTGFALLSDLLAIHRGTEPAAAKR